jgi:hypothetical protein
MREAVTTLHWPVDVVIVEGHPCGWLAAVYVLPNLFAPLRTAIGMAW